MHYGTVSSCMFDRSIARQHTRLPNIVFKPYYGVMLRHTM